MGGDGSLDPVLDLIVAEQDSARVWWRDLEADVADFDQTAFVMALTDVERQALESRGWCFE